MTNYDELINIIDRIATGKQIEADIAVLRQLLSADDRQIATQLGKYNVKITKGKDFTSAIAFTISGMSKQSNLSLPLYSKQRLDQLIAKNEWKVWQKLKGVLKSRRDE